ncbi:MAG: succinate dehydrogenase, cytochrome b556 subunit [Rhodobacteraceae bacterium]|nr:succinate dehydrogenase, cytochrome b556 subunit [Paracoccaceae bacterium]
MADVNRGSRPLSPFMIGQYYRPQLTSITSILTRITGAALIVETVLVVWWLLALSSGPEYFATADFVVTSWLGDLILLLSTWALWYHTLAGLRHLIWDTGRCLDIERAEQLGKIVIGGSLVLTLITIIFV